MPEETASQMLRRFADDLELKGYDAFLPSQIWEWIYDSKLELTPGQEQLNSLLSGKRYPKDL